MTKVASTSPASAVSGKARDQRLDFWRGLCLIDMALVHLVYAGVMFGSVLTPVLGEYLRFAAGGFVVMSGVCIGAIFYPKTQNAETRRSAHLSLWKRAAYLLGVQYAAGAGLLVLDILRGYRGHNESVWRLLRDVLTGREGGDLLVLYIVMIALAPTLMALLRRGWWHGLLAASFGLFVFGQWHPWTLSWTRDANFPLFLWQFVFTFGLVCGTVMHRYDRIRWSRRAVAAGVAWGVYGVLFLAAYGQQFGLHFPKFGLTFHKVPLSVGELLRYFALTGSIVLTTDVLWRRLAGLGLVSYVARLGRHSLMLYVAHLFIQEFIVVASWRLWWIGAWQVLLGVAMIGMLGIIARVLDHKGNSAEKPRRPVLQFLRGWAAPPAGIGAAMVLLLGVGLINGGRGRAISDDALRPMAVTASDVTPLIEELPPTDRNHDHIDDFLNTPMLDETGNA